MRSIASVRRQSNKDTVGHSSVQPWSAGEIFPAVIGLVYRDGEKAYAELSLDGITERFSSWKNAEIQARFLLKNPQHRNRRYYSALASAAAKSYERAVDAYDERRGWVL